jgi:hypothetical protein
MMEVFVTCLTLLPFVRKINNKNHPGQRVTWPKLYSFLCHVQTLSYLQKLYTVKWGVRLVKNRERVKILISRNYPGQTKETHNKYRKIIAISTWVPSKCLLNINKDHYCIIFLLAHLDISLSQKFLQLNWGWFCGCDWTDRLSAESLSHIICSLKIRRNIYGLYPRGIEVASRLDHRL